MNMKVFKQLFKEFWIQFIISLIISICTTYTTFYSIQNPNIFSLIFSVTLPSFAAPFFFLSWLISQYFRVQKQQKVEGEFDTVKTELTNLLTKIEKQTEDLIGYSTGSNCIVYFKPLYPNISTLELYLISESKYPVFDISGEWIDLDERKNNFTDWKRNSFEFGNLYPKQVIMNVMRFDFKNKERLRINIFIYTRSNATITQEILTIKQNNQLYTAIKTISSVGFENTSIQDNFPGYDQQDPDKIFQIK